MTSAEAVTEQDALRWYEFVQERHAEELLAGLQKQARKWASHPDHPEIAAAESNR
ncbi:hypothetical protein ACWDQZ_27440 [Streptomyces tendae]